MDESLSERGEKDPYYHLLLVSTWVTAIGLAAVGVAFVLGLLPGSR